MKCILKLSEQEYSKNKTKVEQLNTILKEVKSPYVFINRISGYAHYNFKCEITSEFVDKLKKTYNRDLDTNDMIILVDKGFSNFGASCEKIGNNKYKGYVNTD